MLSSPDEPTARIVPSDDNTKDDTDINKGILFTSLVLSSIDLNGSQ